MHEYTRWQKDVSLSFWFCSSLRGFNAINYEDNKPRFPRCPSTKPWTPQYCLNMAPRTLFCLCTRVLLARISWFRTLEILAFLRRFSYSKSLWNLHNFPFVYFARRDVSRFIPLISLAFHSGIHCQALIKPLRQLYSHFISIRLS